MSLARLISVMDEAGVDLDVGTILDVLWLASHRPEIRLQRSVSDGLRRDTQITPDANRMTHPATNRDPQARLLDDAPSPRSPNDVPSNRSLAEKSLDSNSVPVYPLADTRGPGRRASPVRVATASPLPDSLAFMRALRPFQQRWPSARDLEIDEQATAHLTAELRTAALGSLFPVFRPVSERWFEVDLVLEDDDAVELWRDLLKAFAQVLRHTGAFRSVREWRLYTATGRGSANSSPDMLQAPSGARLPVKALGGTERRLILFASHASSRHWSSGIYARLLTSWAINSSVVLLHLLPADTWMRTPLGEPIGTCSTYRSGAANIMLDAYPYWWSPTVEEPQATVAIPMVELLPTAIQQWAAMLMGRGRSTPALILPINAMPAPSQSGEQADLIPIEVNRRVAALLENAPKAFQLAVLLSTAPFTIPVARLIQEAHFGRADQRQISELFVSGLLLSLRNEQDRITPAWYQIHPLAGSVLRRSLRVADAEKVAASLIDRVSAHIESVTGRQTEMTNFMLDEAGKFALPDWAQPFALVASRLRTPPERSPTTALKTLREQLPVRGFGRLVRLAVTNQPLDRDEIGSDTWDLLLASHLTSLDQTGRRFFTLTARDLFTKIDQAQPILGSRLLWVDDRPSNNVEFRKHFENEGSTVVEVMTTNDALATLSNDFDIIISDMGRVEGGREGFRLLAELKAVTNPPPTIIFSDGFAASSRRRNEAIRAGAVACTNDARELRRIVHEVIRRPFVEGPVAKARIGIFVSYSQKDRHITEVLVDALNSLSPDLDVFFDRASLEAGDDYRAKISDVIQTSQWFILVFRGGEESQQDMSWSFYEAGTFRAKLVESDKTKTVRDRLCYLYDRAPPSPLASYAGTRISTRDRNNVPLNVELDADDSLAFENTELFDLLRLILTTSATTPLRNVDDPDVRRLMRNGVQKITRAYVASELPPEVKTVGPLPMDAVPKVASRILVAGSGTSKLPESVRLPARILGERLAFEGFCLVTGGWPGVDQIVATAFSETLRKLGREPGSHYTQVLEAGDPGDFTIDGAKIITLSDWAAGSVEQCDVAVLIGGIGGTLSIFEATVAAGKPAIPLGQSGGDAAKAMHALRSESKIRQTFLPKALQFVDLPLGSVPAAAVAVDGALDLVRLHLDVNLQRTYQALAALLLEIGASMDPSAANSARRSTLRESSGPDRYFSLLAQAAGQPRIFETRNLNLGAVDPAALALEPFARDQPRWLAIEFVELSRSTTQTWQHGISIQLAIIIALLRADSFDLFTDIVDRLKITDLKFFEQLNAQIIKSNSSQLLTDAQTSRLNEWLIRNGSSPIPSQIERPRNRPVQIRFPTLLQFDSNEMLASIRPYIDREEKTLPGNVSIDVQYPEEFIERLAVLTRYSTSDKWPNSIMSADAKSQVRDLVDNLLPKLTRDLTSAVRTTIAALAISSGSQSSSNGLASLETYVRARVFSTGRVLASTWLEGEASPPWRAQFSSLDKVWSNRTLYGITWVLQERLHATFWADADLDVSKSRVRVFVPQKIGAGRSELDDLSQEDCCRILVPQVLDGEEGNALVSTVASLLGAAPSDFWVDLVFRGESIIETETHNFPSGNWDAKERAVRIAAQYIADQLRSLPKRERARHFRLQMVEARVLPDLREKVIEIASDIADDL